MESLYIGIDLGTSSVKALVVDGSGREAALGSADCRVNEPALAWQEQDALEVWSRMVSAVGRALDGLDPARVRAICLSSAMHGFMALDQKGEPLMRMLTWADGRSQAQAERLARGPGGSDIYRRTGTPPTALYYPARIIWLRENKPDLFSQASRFASIKDWIVNRLAGRWVMDRSHASSNGLLDISRLEWDLPVLEAAGISPEKLPELVDPDEPAGELTADAAKELGLAPGIPVVPGAGDGGLANLGSGAIDPGQAAATIGTSGAMRKISSRPWLHPHGATWCYYLASGRWYAGGAINSGGIILRWLRDGLLSEVRDAAIEAGEDPYQRIIALAAESPPGAEGLIFLPYLYGERTPYWNPNARGVLFGLSPRHGKAHLARAALEGICMCMAHVFECLEGSPDGVAEIRCSGGFTRSTTWVQILSDVLGHALSLPSARESSAMGAAVLGMKATGHIDSLGAAREMFPAERTFEPDLKNRGLYREKFALWKKLYSQVEADFAGNAD